MRKNILLTGERGAGKSTVVRSVAAYFECEAGFYTRWRGDELLLLALSEDESVCRDAAALRGGGRVRAIPGVFDRKGAALLEQTENARLVIMDELGVLERDAPTFRSAVLSALGGKARVLAVVRERGDEFLDALKNRADSELIRVTAENRDALPAAIIRELAGSGGL